MGNAERTQELPSIAAQASARYGSRGVPEDWYLDPADPDAAQRYREESRTSLEDQATAFLAEHEALADLESGTASPSALLLFPSRSDPSRSDEEQVAPPAPLEAGTAQPAWIGMPLTSGVFDDEGELGWQADALCAQTDPEAFFPEKGGSTRDAKKVCGACTVRAECLEYALESDERFGIWGGLSERERRRLRKRAV